MAFANGTLVAIITGGVIAHFDIHFFALTWKNLLLPKVAKEAVFDSFGQVAGENGVKPVCAPQLRKSQ